MERTILVHDTNFLISNPDLMAFFDPANEGNSTHYLSSYVADNKHTTYESFTVT